MVVRQAPGTDSTYNTGGTTGLNQTKATEKSISLQKKWNALFNIAYPRQEHSPWGICRPACHQDMESNNSRAGHSCPGAGSGAEIGPRHLRHHQTISNCFR